MDALNQILCGDCLQILPQLPDHSIDLVLCDLPFGLTAPQWDKHIPMDQLWQQYRRLLKKSGTVALFACQPFTTKVIASNEKHFRYCWYWLKNQSTNFFHAKRMPTRRVEEICVFFKGKYYPQISEGHVPTNSAKGCSNGKAYFGTNRRNYTGGKTTRYPTNVLEFKCVDNYSRRHSSEKPVDLCEYLIKTYTESGEVVLDNCVGSGSTAVAAKKCGRHFIGIDIMPEFCDIARQRIQELQCPEENVLPSLGTAAKLLI